jgi:hypothetical protein
MLASVSMPSLRLLRNEVYARHGRSFQTPWLAEHFRKYPWYEPGAEYSDAELSAVEKANIALVTSREQRLHDELGTRELVGLLLELRLVQAARLVQRE